jgi:hydroxymethylpyrimidine/phosphomethylpyrimidine kinase
MQYAISVPAPASPRLSRPLAALTIAGSDSGGGAGLQADLRTFAAHGVLGTTAITAVTAQNTLGVEAWEPVSPGLVRAQITAVLGDLPVRAAKTGMLGNRAIIEAVAEALEALGGRLPLVIDPVMVATSGHRLLEPEAEGALRDRLLPLATVLTPNRLEAAVLSGRPVGDSPLAHAERIALAAPRAWIVVKGGHRVAGEAVDVAVDTVLTPSGEVMTLTSPWLETRATHGTGCTLSAAIAAQMALGEGVGEAIRRARAYLAGALQAAVAMGGGHGPVDHLFALAPSVG